MWFCCQFNIWNISRNYFIVNDSIVPLDHNATFYILVHDSTFDFLFWLYMSLTNYVIKAKKIHLPFLRMRTNENRRLQHDIFWNTQCFQHNASLFIQALFLIKPVHAGVVLRHETWLFRNIVVIRRSGWCG